MSLVLSSRGLDLATRMAHCSRRPSDPKASRSPFGKGSGYLGKVGGGVRNSVRRLGDSAAYALGSDAGVSGLGPLAFLKRRSRVDRPVLIPAPRSGRPVSS